MTFHFSFISLLYKLNDCGIKNNIENKFLKLQYKQITITFKILNYTKNKIILK